jgi:2-keto-3-deoxy-6-phosphogluconate aldolase
VSPQNLPLAQAITLEAAVSNRGNLVNSGANPLKRPKVPAPKRVGRVHPFGLAIYLQHPIATTIGGSWLMDTAPINGSDWVKITQSTRSAFEVTAGR